MFKELLDKNIKFNGQYLARVYNTSQVRGGAWKQGVGERVHVTLPPSLPEINDFMTI